MGRLVLSLCLAVVLASCSRQVKVARVLDEVPDIYPDYADVVIPPNIAPLNFKLKGEEQEARVLLEADSTCCYEIPGKDGSFVIPLSKWRKLVQRSEGRSLAVTVKVRRGEEWVAYQPFPIHVAEDSIDACLVYRRIAPLYELWNEMGIYQRNLSDYTQKAILENKMTGHNCINCHSFGGQRSDRMLFHMRGKVAGTVLSVGGEWEKLNTKTAETLSALVYPSWHPSGRYVAFSVNKTNQGFHLNDRNRIEVYDEASDVVIYDVERHEIWSAPALFSKDAFETFPTFSPEGDKLYFCSAEARPVPEEYEKVKYHLCAVSFNPQTREIGQKVDTLYHAGRGGRSASFPRVSPDGSWLMYTLSGYGNFSIWHKDADLQLVDLTTGKHRALDEVNSDDVESYHSWSSNSRWFVFSSRRKDGLYTHPYIAWLGEDGKVGKPFLLPQEDASFYDTFMQSFNIPEFVTSEVRLSAYDIASGVQKEKGIDVAWRGF